MKKWYAFDLGPNGGPSGNSFSPPFDSQKDAEAWAINRFPKTSVAQIAIVELVAVAERATPPVTITPIHAFGEVAKAA